MSNTPILGAPELVENQAIPETTVNEIVRYVEQGAAWFRFKDRNLATPPGSPADGDCYLVATSGTGAWSGHDGEIAFYMSTAWEFITAKEGMAAYIADEDIAVAFNGSSWTQISSSSANPTESLIIACSDMTTALTTGDGKAAWVVPYNFTLTEVFIALTGAQSSSGAVTIDTRISGGSTIFSTPPSIDASEDTSLTGTAAVLSTTALTKGQILLTDIDAAGTGAKGLVQVFVGYRT